MRKKQALIIFSGLCAYALSAYPQQVISSSGKYLMNGSGSIVFTIGECVIETIGKDNLVLTQGFHQPILIAEPSTSIADRSSDFGIEISAYPNPVTDFIYVRVDKPENLSYRIFDINGRLLENKLLETEITEISFEKRLPAAYIIKLIDNKNVAIKSFIIIKN